MLTWTRAVTTEMEMILLNINKMIKPAQCPFFLEAFIPETLHIWNASTVLGFFPKINCIKNHGENFTNSCQSTACQSVPRWHIFLSETGPRCEDEGKERMVGSSATPFRFYQRLYFCQSPENWNPSQSYKNAFSELWVCSLKEMNESNGHHYWSFLPCGFRLEMLF